MKNLVFYTLFYQSMVFSFHFLQHIIWHASRTAFTHPPGTTVRDALKGNTFFVWVFNIMAMPSAKEKERETRHLEFLQAVLHRREKDGESIQKSIFFF